MKFSISLIRGKQTASFRIASLLLAIAPLWLMLAAANRSAHAQTSNTAVPSSTNASTTPSPADWTQFHRDNMQRWNPYETVLGVKNAASLQLKWKIPLGLSQQDSPAVVNGVVYVASGAVFALNASTGAQLWSYSTEGLGVFVSPAVANGAVYVGATPPYANQPEGEVLALNATTGAKLWSYATGGGMESSPAVANGSVYIGSDNNVYALNAGTGALLWKYAATGGNENTRPTAPAVTNGVVYIGLEDGNVHALNASTGAKLWSYATGSLLSSPAVVNGVVYVGCDDGNLYALNADTGALLWRHATGGSVESSPAVANGVVYVGSEDGGVYALNADTGAEVWSYTIGANTVVDSSPALANGVVYVGTVDILCPPYLTPKGNILALDANTGAKLWSYDTPVYVNSDPAVVDGVLYVGSLDTTYAFSVGADLFLRIRPTLETVHQGDLITYAFPVWNLGPANAVHEVLNTQVPEGTTFDYIRISGTPGLGTCTHPPYQGTGQIVCHENGSMAANTTWTVRLTVKVTAPSGTVITANAATLADTPDPNPANNTATVSIKVQ